MKWSIDDLWWTPILLLIPLFGFCALCHYSPKTTGYYWPKTPAVNNRKLCIHCNGSGNNLALGVALDMPCYPCPFCHGAGYEN